MLIQLLTYRLLKKFKIRLSETLPDSDTRPLSIATDVDSTDITGTTEVYARDIAAEVIQNQNILKPVKF